jgi:AcrR family transcriptional regulator
VGVSRSESDAIRVSSNVTSIDNDCQSREPASGATCGGGFYTHCVDSRQKKTRAKLASVVLSLASDRPASEITASEIAVAAEINRSTFYQHAASPVALLERVLKEELDEIRDRHLGEAALENSPDASGAIEQVTRAVLRHLDSHAAIYLRGLGSGSGSSSLQPLLSEHFAGTMTMLFARHALTIPTLDDAPASAAFVADSAARFVANGTVGAIEVWLRTPEPRDEDQFMRAFHLFLPSWWPRALPRGL